MELLHQAGHNAIWNFDSFAEDNAGDGVIIGPRYERKGRVEDLADEVKEASFFDPQFFLPSVARGKLDTYDFHPDVIASGFDTAEFAGEQAFESAKRCLAFQKEHGFRSLIIPTRHVKGMPTDLMGQLETLFVEPYLEAASEVAPNEELLLQMVLNDGMLQDQEYRDDLLNWVTSFQEIDGVYLLVEKKDRRKQIEDINFLFWMLRFIDDLRRTDMKVIVGYCNTEGVILSLADPTAVTMGSYENMRMFRIGTFQEREGRSGPPTPRIFSAKMLQWIDHNYIGAIERALGEKKEDIFEDNTYRATLFDDSFEWHFTKPSLYKHSFLVYDDLISDIPDNPGEDRLRHVNALLERARTYFNEIGRSVVFDRDGGSKHLAPWQTAVNQFADYKGWS